MKLLINNTYYNINASLLQANILLIVLEYKNISFKDLLSIIKIDKNNLQTIIGSMLIRTLSILQKIPASKTIDLTDIISINKDFTNKLKSFSLPLIKLSDNKSVVEKVNMERINIVNAVIVRIMKTRRELLHNELIYEIGNQIKIFIVNIKVIKECIQMLIHQEYIKRDSENFSNYIYIP